MKIKEKIKIIVDAILEQQKHGQISPQTKELLEYLIK